MRPLGLTFKGGSELCLVHMCLTCGKIHYNRLASDDNPSMVLGILREAKEMTPETRELVIRAGVVFIEIGQEESVRIQLFGRST